MKITPISLMVIMLISLKIGTCFAENNLVVIVDASDSMKDTIDGVSWLTMLKKGAARFISSLDADVALGMIVCGNTKNKGCDAQLMEIPIRPMDQEVKENMQDVIKQMTPRGEAPLAEAIHRALAMLDNMADNRAIVILSNGRDTCSFHPCEDMAELFQKEAAIPVHGIHIGSSGHPDMNHLNCFSRIGRGRLYPAVNDAAVYTHLHQVLLENGANLEVTLEITPGKPYDGPMTATLYHLYETFPYQEYTGHPAFFSVYPGQYRLTVQCTDRRIQLEKTLDDVVVTGEKHQTIRIDMDMGKIDLQVYLADDKTLPAHMTVSVFQAGDHDTPVFESDLNPFASYLPKGTYDLRCHIDHKGFVYSSWVEGVNVIPGKITHKSINLHLGKLELIAYEQQQTIYGGPARISVYPAGNHDTPLLVTDTHPASLYLPEGRYDVQFEMNDGVINGAYWKIDLPVTTEKITRAFFSLALGALHLITNARENVPLQGPVTTDIFRSGAYDTPFFTSKENPLSASLTMGKYDIRVTYESAVGPRAKWRQDIVVMPGKTVKTAIDMDLKTFEVHFSSADMIDISDFVKTTIFRNNDTTTPLLQTTKGPLHLLIPMDTYDLKFEVMLSDNQKIFWKKNVIVNNDPVQSFTVTFPTDSKDL